MSDKQQEEMQQHQDGLSRFIDLANKLKDEGVPTGVVTAAMMSATGVYATYTAAGNDGALNDAGVEKLTEEFRRRVQHVQDHKRGQHQPKQ